MRVHFDLVVTQSYPSFLMSRNLHFGELKVLTSELNSVFSLVHMTEIWKVAPPKVWDGSLWPPPWKQSQAVLHKWVCLSGTDIVYESLEGQSVYSQSPDGCKDSWRNTERRAWKWIRFTECLSEQRQDRKRFVLTGPINYRNTKH